MQRLSPRTANILERIAREEHELAAVRIGTLTVKLHCESVSTCDVHNVNFEKKLRRTPRKRQETGKE